MCVGEHIRTTMYCAVLSSMYTTVYVLHVCIYIHRVLNTDNMSIVGLTIDYGPYGFMDRYDPGHICNGSGLPNTCTVYICICIQILNMCNV